MKADALDSYLTRRFDSIEKNLHAYGEDMNPKRLHRLRVDIKKTRAVLSFIRKTYEKEYNLSPLKTIFKRAGELREAQLHIQLLQEQSAPPDALLTHLENQKNGRKGALKRYLPTYLDDVRQVRENIKLPPEKLSRKKVEAFLGDRLDKAREDIEGKDREKAHRFRKRLKNALYVYKALPKKLKKKVALDAGYLDKVQQKAGDWHDTYAALDYISQHADAPKSTDSREQLLAKEEKQFKALVKKVKIKRLTV